MYVFVSLLQDLEVGRGRGLLEILSDALFMGGIMAVMLVGTGTLP